MAEPYAVKMPQLSDTMTEGVMVSWEKKVGDAVSRGDIVATVETDKAIMDVEVFRDGFLAGPLAAEGDTVEVGGALGFIVATAADASQEVSDHSTTTVAEKTTPVETVTDTEAVSKPEGVAGEIKMPQLSDTMTEGVVVSWEKEIGDKLERGDIVATVETDKAVMDVEIFREGYLSGPQASIDSVIPVNGIMAYIVEASSQVVSETVTKQATADDEPETFSSPMAKPAVPENVPVIHSTGSGTPMPRPAGKKATPFARKIAGNNQVNLNTIQGSGPAGVIIGADVQKAAPSTSPAIVEPHVEGDGRAMTMMERAISQTMSTSLTMPTFHVTINADPAALIKASKKAGVSLTVAIAKACANAMEKQPQLNWAYQPTDKLIERGNVDIGMAVATEDGLVVPVLRGCESRDIESLNEDWKVLVDKARKRRLSPEEYSNPTFMVSNMGMMGVSYFDAIPTAGTSAILAISSAGPQGMPLTITADHRVANGADVAMYLNSLKENIEQPESWMGPMGPAIPEGNWDYDVVVIGGGPGGEDCARDLVQQGLKVAMVNDAPFPGGECLWRGCIPSKAWRAAADRIRDRAHDSRLGVEGSTSTSLNWKNLEATRKDVLETRGGMALNTDKAVKIEVIHGFARFESDHTVSIDTSNNSDNPHQRMAPGDGTNTKTVSFGCAVIATGAPPFIPPIPGAKEAVTSGGLLTSDTVWALTEQPKKLAVVGAGAIGVEMAQIFQDFGAKVTLIEAQDRILAEVEPEIAKQLTAILNKDPNLTAHTNAQVSKLSGKPGAMKLSYSTADGEQSLDCDYVIMATGKRPDLTPLKIDAVGINLEGPVIKVDKQCRTNLPHIFAVGDVNGGLMLAHTAGQQGRVVADTILGESNAYDEEKDCGVIFTRPQAAFVGLSVEQAKAKGIDAAEIKTPMSIDAKAMINGETDGLIKMVVDKKNQKIIGVHFLADHADLLIGEAVLMVSCGLTLAQVGHAIHPHPTQTEIFGDMARRLSSRLNRSKKKR